MKMEGAFTAKIILNLSREHGDTYSTYA